MSSAGISTTETLLSPRGPQVSSRPPESVLNNRLDALREIALSLLTELETLGHAGPPATGKIRLDDEVKRFEIDLIRAALDKAHGNQARAARMLGVKKTTLNAKIKRYQIQHAGRDFNAPFDTEKHEIAA
jgi:transcriptional regulator with GAF, ATPase, and Fis domain